MIEKPEQNILGRRANQSCKRIPWNLHAWELSQCWKPGDHVAVVAPTDWGKSWLTTRGLHPLWPNGYKMLVIDVKGDDPTLEGIGNKVSHIPHSFWRMFNRDNQIYRLVVSETVDNVDKARIQVREALKKARAEKRWVIHLNEVKALTDARAPGLGLAPYVEQLWLRGRPHITVISETQAPAWVPRSMYQQASHVYLGYGLDEDYQDRLGEVGGNRDIIRNAIDSLREHEFVYVRRVTGEMKIVKAPA